MRPSDCLDAPRPSSPRRGAGSLRPGAGLLWSVARPGALAAALWLGAGGCGREERAVREWRASDHAEPGVGEPTGQAAPSAAPGAGEPAPAGAVRDPGAAPSSGPPSSPEAQEARAAAELYGVICASCHGAGGDGDGPARPPGVAMPRFAAAAWQASRTDEALAQVIVEGRGTMPPFGQQVNPRGVAALVRHLRSLGASDGAASGAEGPGTVGAPPPATAAGRGDG